MEGIEQDLERSQIQQMLEGSCWIINNEKDKLVVGLWRTSQHYEVTNATNEDH